MRDLYHKVEELLGVQAESVRALSGGCVGEVYGLRLSDGREIVAKVDQSTAPRLDVEGYMLQYLAEHSALPVPEVYHSAPELLLMARLPGDSRFDSGAEVHAAELLADLHRVSSPKHGLEKATLIGGLHQPNTPSSSWIDFFREQRLLYMSDEAFREGVMPKALYKRICAFGEDLEKLLEEPAAPALLHGDVWTTNVLAKSGRITGFIDPAVYYGHPEIELAFITLFGTFSQSFFDAYHERNPIAPGFFDVRRDIYNLYPLLVHARLFGASYLGSVERTLGRHGY